MAKKATVKKAPAKKTAEKTIKEIKTHPHAIAANEALNERLEGLEDYYTCKSKEDLQDYVTGVVEKMAEYEDSNKVLQQHFFVEVQTLEKEFNATAEKNFTHCMHLCGHMVSTLNDCLILNS